MAALIEPQPHAEAEEAEAAAGFAGVCEVRRRRRVGWLGGRADADGGEQVGHGANPSSSATASTNSMRRPIQRTTLTGHELPIVA